MSYQNNAPSIYYHSEFSALNQEIEQNDSINDYYYYDTPNLDFMEKNNSNQNNGENFLTNINHNFEKNFDYDKEDLSIFQKETDENNINVNLIKRKIIIIKKKIMIIKKRNNNTEEQKEKYIFEDETTPTIDSKNDNDNITLNGNLIKESSIEIKNEKEIASMINNILNSSQTAPLTIEKNNFNNNFNAYSTTIIL